MTVYKDDSVMLHTDLYQINMGETYWEDGIHNKKSVFEVFFRKLPFGNGYAVFAGLERIINYIESFRFSESDITYLREEVGFKEDYLDFLKELRFTGNIRSMVEGSLCFKMSPFYELKPR